MFVKAGHFKLFFLFFIVVSLFVGASVKANVSLPVVRNYSQAADPTVWDKLKSSEIPNQLVNWPSLPDPNAAYQAPYQTIFLQTKNFVVCWQSCDGPQPFWFTKEGADTKAVSNQAGYNPLLATSTVYFWLDTLFAKMQTLGFKAQKKLTVVVNRHIPDPNTGMDFYNNAFFNDKDWSLNFLDSQNTWYLAQTGRSQLSSFFDPSVAMHEASHSVFQALIGDVINSEVLGLHEAFADYFSLSVLDTSKLGLIMARGKPMRTADHIEKYDPSMESHKLGNVVLSALWKIRSLAHDKFLADQIALETVRVVSANPYAIAGDVIPAYEEAYQRLATGERMPDLKIVRGVWTETGLAPNPLKPDVEQILKRGEISFSRSGRVTEEIPASIAKAWGVPSRSDEAFTIHDVRSSAAEMSLWVNLGTTSKKEDAIWVLLNLSTDAIVAAYSKENGVLKLITRDDSTNFAKLKALSENKENWEQLLMRFPASVISFFDLRNSLDGPVRNLIKNGPIQQNTGPVISLNGSMVQTTALSREIKPTLIGNVAAALSSITDPKLKELFKTLVGITLYVVPSEILSNSQALQINGVRSFVVGYTLTMNSGIHSTFFLSDFKGDISVKVNPKKKEAN